MNKDNKIHRLSAKNSMVQATFATLTASPQLMATIQLFRDTFWWPKTKDVPADQVINVSPQTL